MKKQLSLYLYATAIILAGCFLIFFANNSFTVLKLALGISLIVGAFFALVTAVLRQKKPTQFNYHQMHALAMLVYGMALLMFCDSTETLVSFTAFLFIFFTFSEVIFSSWLFNLGQQVLVKIAVLRALFGLVVGIGTAIAMNYTVITFQVFGVLFVMVGVSILLYVPVIKSTPTLATSKFTQP